MEGLAEQVRQPCTVAVVGQVKVGKSTFVNALLRGDFAKVGSTETTATINYFSYVSPEGYDADRPVRCYWRGGGFSDESREFLDGLQGNDLETLLRADGIDRLEYRLPIDLLEQITLVDTPGTGAVVEEHEDRTAEFIQLNAELRERHDKETRELNDRADAIIYLVGEVARSTDEEFLKKFAEATGGRSSARNAIGVMSKIELQPEVLARRHELAGKIAGQLTDTLNTVVPVAAGVSRTLEQLLKDDRAGLERMVETLRHIPEETLEMLLDDPAFFKDMDLPECPVGTTERRELLGETNWAVFATVAAVAADRELGIDEVEKKLEEITGLGPLWEILTKHFIERGHILRCYRIARDAQEVLKRLRFEYLPQHRKELNRENERLERYVGFIRRPGGDPITAAELESFVRANLDASRRTTELEKLYWDLGGEWGLLYSQLEEYNGDFEALQKLQEADHAFSQDELNELRPLLGQYGGELEKRLPPGRVDADYAGQRQRYWKRKREEAPYGSLRYAVADQAFDRLALIIDELLARVGK
jgi:hypothetical protein